MKGQLDNAIRTDVKVADGLLEEEKDELKGRVIDRLIVAKIFSRFTIGR